MPKTNHPAFTTQQEAFVYNDICFLTGTFGNDLSVNRTCMIPTDKSIFFPVIYKEDSFAEDQDLHTESELIKRARAFADQVTYLNVNLDGHPLEPQRIQSDVFDLTFPLDCMYDVQPGPTRAVCDGYWIFLSPVTPGLHNLHFMGISYLGNDIVTEQIKNEPVYRPFLDYIDKHAAFKVDVMYNLKVN